MMSTPQSGILPQSSPFATFLTLAFQPGKEAQAREGCGAFPGLIQSLRESDWNSELCGVLGIGSDCWNALFPGERPKELHPFIAFEDEARKAPSTPADLFIHIRSSRPDLNFLLAKNVMAGFGDSVTLIEEFTCFRYLDSRDLTGFVDGTENPEGEERAQVALVEGEDATFAAGSYIHIQRYIHDLNQWEKLAIADQEKVIGRTKPNDVELDDEAKPPTAHISRVVIEENGEELEILRHSMPYGNTRSAGLYFVAYGRSPTVFEKMLSRMISRDVEGHYDHLMDYSQAVTGAAFFAPSREFLKKLGQPTR